MQTNPLDVDHSQAVAIILAVVAAIVLLASLWR